MNRNVIDRLNEAIALEHTLAMQCHQYALTVSGLWRLSLAPFFEDLAEEARGHARKFGQKVVALGGTPSTMVRPIQASGRAEAMVADVLRMEREALALYGQALASVDAGDVALRTMLEDHIEAEQRHVDEVERLVLGEQVEARVQNGRSTNGAAAEHRAS